MSGSLWHVTRDGTPAAPGAEGFVHASFTHQLARTLEVHFAGTPGVELLLLDPGRLGAALRLEPSRDGADFPHVYRPLRADDVLARVRLRRGADGRFSPGGLPA